MPTMTPTERATLASTLRLACMRISRRVRFESAATVAPHQFSVLVRLGESPRTAREIAEIECVSAPSMSRTVAALVAAGWVARTSDPTDGRQVILSLTPEGRRLLAATRKTREGWMAQRLTGLTDHELSILKEATAILERIASA